MGGTCLMNNKLTHQISTSKRGAKVEDQYYWPHAGLHPREAMAPRPPKTEGAAGMAT